MRLGRASAETTEAEAAAPRRGRARALTLGDLRRLGVPGAGLLKLDPTVIAAALGVNLLGLALPLASLQIYDRVLPQQGVATLTAIGIGLAGVALLEFLLRAGQGLVLNFAALRHAQLLQVAAIRGVLEGRIGKGESPAVVLERFNAIERIGDHFGGSARLAAIDLPFSILFLAMIAVIGGPLVLAPLAVVGLFLLAVGRLAAQARTLAEAREDYDGKSVDFTSEIFGAVQSVKSFGVEPMMQRRFERLLKGGALTQLRLVENAADLQRLSTVYGNLGMVATLSFGAVMVIEGALSIGGLAACSLLSGRAIQPMLRAARASSETQKAAVAAEQVARLFPRVDEPPMSTGPAADRAPRLEAVDLTVEIGGRRLIEGARFAVEAGELAAIVGADGSGRSRLLRLIAGLEPVTHGRLTLDGRPCAEFRTAPGARVAHLGAQAQPFAGSILQNLTLFGRGASVADALRASELIGLDAQIHQLPDGYDTVIATGAASALSAGVMRGVMIARTLARRPRLLLLDDAFAHLDADFAATFYEALRGLRDEMTIVLIATQAAHAAGADIVLELEGGAIRVGSPLAYAAPRAAGPRTAAGAAA